MSDSATPDTNAWMWVGKLAPPQSQLDAVRRDSLLLRLSEHRRSALALLISPPGFGKTTLLSQWRGLLQSESPAMPVAWLSLDEADADPNRFLAYMLLALEAAGVDLAGMSQRAHAQAMDANPQRTLASLIAALERSDRRVVVMLDDYHRACTPAVDEILMLMLERGGRWLQFVVASRVRPRWPLGSLKARGLLHEVAAGDLVLSLAESSQILGDGLDRAALSIVHSRTEGWAVAVQLARLWLSRGTGSSSGLKAFDGRVADVAEYLAEQVIETLPLECQEFLIETSPLERFNAELADVARSRTDSADLLARLAPFEALLVPLDAGRQWFRYHLMLADFLRPRLDARRAEQIHRAAAGWLARQQDWVLAVSHALQALDTALAVRIVHEAGGWELVLKRGIQYTQGLLQQFDGLTRRTEPELLLMQSYLYAKLGDEPLSTELLRLAEVAVKNAPELQRDFDVISAMVHGYFDRFEACARWPVDGPAANLALPDDPLGQAILLCGSAVAALAWGRMEEVGRAARDAHMRMRLVDSPLGENYCLLHIAQADGITGQIAASRARINEALGLAEANFGTDSSLKALVGCFKAQHLYWQGLWSEAAPWLLAGQETLAHVDGWLDVFATTAEVSWRIALRAEGLQQALLLLDNTAQMARSRALARLTRLVSAWRVDVLAQCGLLTQAQQEAQASSLEAMLADAMRNASASGMDWRFIEAAGLGLARLQLATGAALAAQTRLESLARRFEAARLALPAWRLRLMSMLARRRARDGELSAAEAQDALEPIVREGLAGLLLEVGPLVLPVLLQLEGTLPPAIISVLTQLRGWQAHPPRQRPQLSAKETEVLQLLIAGQPNKAIARALNVTENTVKFHLKQVFHKLGVDSRSAAISAALRQGFVSSLHDPV
jgi:LuxR family transcriptional regulator, maltose regulon positive regulatory protein